MAITIPEEIITLDPKSIDFGDRNAIKALIIKLLNIIEAQAQLIETLQNKIQDMENEINRLKGEKEKPKFSPTVPKKDDEIPGPKKEKNWTKGDKKPRIKIDRTIKIEVDKKNLPSDAEHKGYRSVIVQNIKFGTDNVEYKLERFYSPSEKKLYEAKLPDNVNGLVTT